MICPGCRCFFCYEGDHEPGQPLPSYCQPSCRRDAHQRRRAAMAAAMAGPPYDRLLCPVTGKIPYRDEAEARAEITRINASNGKGLADAYPCRGGCAWWHTTGQVRAPIRVTRRGQRGQAVLTPGLLLAEPRAGGEP